MVEEALMDIFYFTGKDDCCITELLDFMDLGDVNDELKAVLESMEADNKIMYREGRIFDI